MPQIDISDLRQKNFITLTNSETGDIIKVIAPNGLELGIDDAVFPGAGLKLPSKDAPAVTASKLYNENGVLKFNGVTIVSGSLPAPTAGGWTDAGDSVHLTTSTDKVGIGTDSPTYKLHVSVTDTENIGGVFIDFDETGGHHALEIDSESLTGYTVYSHGKHAAGFTQDLPEGFAIYAFRNLSEVGSYPVARFEEKNATSTQAVLSVKKHDDGTGDILNLFDGSTQVVTVDASGDIGIGTTSPDVTLDLVAEGEGCALYLKEFGSGSPDIIFYRADNTEAVPEAIGNNDLLGGLYWYGYDGNSFEQAAAIKAYGDGTVGDEVMPASLRFYTRDVAAPTYAEERMRIDNAGNVGIGTGEVDVNKNLVLHGDNVTFRIGCNTGGSNNSSRIEMPEQVDGTSHEQTYGAFLDWNGDASDAGGGQFSIGMRNGSETDALVFQIHRDAIADSLCIADSSQVGIGTTAPAHMLEVHTDTGFGAEIGIVQINNTAANDGANLRIKRARGTQAIPTIVSSGDLLGSIAFYGFDGVDYASEAAAIFAEVDGTPGANDMPGRLKFYTTPDGSETRAERLRIESDGGIFWPGLQQAGGTSTYLKYNITNDRMEYLASTRKVKKDIIAHSLGLDIIEKLNPVEFTYKSTPDTRTLGFIAEEAAAVHPLLAIYGPDFEFDEGGNIVKEWVNDDGEKGGREQAKKVLSEDSVPAMWDDQAVVSVLVNAVKELKERVEALESA